MTKGLKKLTAIRDEEGYLKVCEKLGMSKSRLNDLISQRRPAEGITLRVAFRLRKVYGIEYADWFEKEDREWVYPKKGDCLIGLLTNHYEIEVGFANAPPWRRDKNSDRALTLDSFEEGLYEIRYRACKFVEAEK